MKRKTKFFRKRLFEPNFFIGNVGDSYITSASVYASKTISLVASDVKNFQIDGSNNISFYVDLPHSYTAAFIQGTNATYIIDTLGTGSNNFVSGNTMVRNALLMKFVYMPAQTLISGNRVDGNSVCIKIGLPNLVTLNGGTAFSNYKGKLLSLPKLANAINTSVIGSGMTNLERIYLPLFTNVDQLWYDQFFVSCKINGKIYHHASMGATDRKSWGWILCTGWNIGDVLEINGLIYTAVAGAPVNPGDFRADVIYQTANTNLTNVINADTRTGTVGDVQAIYRFSRVYFLSTITGASANTITIDGSGVTAPTFQQSGSTFTGGTDVHYMLQYLRDDRGWTLIELTAPISVDPPTSLSGSNQTATSVDLNFTAPTPNANGTECFQVWVDDGTVYRKWFEYAEISTSGDTLDLTDVFNDLGSISGAKIKIRTMDGKMNFSAFSNEITLT